MPGDPLPLAVQRKLPEDQREVLILVGASGLSYDEAAEICGVAVGTIKSRMNCARGRPAQLLGIASAADLASDRLTSAVVKQGGSAALKPNR